MNARISKSWSLPFPLGFSNNGGRTARELEATGLTRIA